MKKYNTLEKISVLLSIIGLLLFLSDKFYPIKSIASITQYAELIVIVALLIGAYGRWKRLESIKDKKAN